MATTQSTSSTPAPDSVPLSLLPAYSPHNSPAVSQSTPHTATITSPAISFAKTKILSSFTTYTSSYRPAGQDSSTSQDASNEDRLTNKLSTGTEVGIGLAIAIFIIAVFCAIGLIYRKRRTRRKQTATARVEMLHRWYRNQDMEISQTR